MNFPRYSVHLFYLILLFSNCVQEFDPPSQGYENLLVVEALLLNGVDAFEVKLSRSIPIDTSAFISERGASVILTSNSGEDFILAESSAGVYQHNGIINAQVGTSYQLHIQTANGNQYESTEVMMHDTPEIDDVRFEYEEKPNGQKGVQVYLNTHDPNNNTWYYRWEWEETWEFSTPYDSYLYWEDDEIKMRMERINTCWKFDNSSSIEISTSKNLSSDYISDFPLLYVTTETDRLNRRYSLNVKQYSLSEESYTFWKELQKITENLGTLFDPQPSVVKGNIYNINNENEIVLGYFDASVVQEQRIFITVQDIPPTRFPNYYSYCTDSIVSADQIPGMAATNYWLIGETVNEAGFPAYSMSTPGCIDCTLYGTNKKPAYWN